MSQDTGIDVVTDSGQPGWRRTLRAILHILQPKVCDSPMEVDNIQYDQEDGGHRDGIERRSATNVYARPITLP